MHANALRAENKFSVVGMVRGSLLGQTNT